MEVLSCGPPELAGVGRSRDFGRNAKGPEVGHAEGVHTGREDAQVGWHSEPRGAGEGRLVQVGPTLALP